MNIIYYTRLFLVISLISYTFYILYFDFYILLSYLMFSLDIRSLALMRIILGCAILRDLSIIASTLSGLLGDQSVLPPSVAFSHYFEQNYRTIHILSGKLWWQIFLIVIHIALALAFTLGRKTKYTTPLLWFFVCSIQ